MTCIDRSGRVFRVALLIAALLCVATEARAGRWRFQSPAEPGIYAVGHGTFEVVDPARDDRTVPVDVWYPVDPEDAVGETTFYDFHVFGGAGVLSEAAVENAAPSTVIRFPLVVYSHGWGGVTTEAGTLMEALASHGFVVAAPSHAGSNSEGTSDPFDVIKRDRPLDVSLAIDAMLARSADPLDPLYLRVHPGRIGVAGFSYGGWTATAVVSGHSEPTAGPDVPPDPRVRAVAAIARKYEVGYASPAAELAAIDVPLFLIDARLDLRAGPITTEAWTFASGRPIYRADVPIAWHEHFSWQCDGVEWLIAGGLPESTAALIFNTISAGETFYDVCRSAALPIPESKRIRDFYVTAFFQRHLLGDIQYEPFLTPAYATAHEPAVVLQRKEVGQP